MAALRITRARLGGVALGAALMAVAVWALGWLAPSDRVTLAMERFDSFCHAELATGAAPDLKGLAKMEPSTFSQGWQQLYWDAAAQVRLGLKPGTCALMVYAAPFSEADEARVAAQFVALAEARLPGVSAEDLAAQNNAALFWIAGDRTLAAGPVMVLSRWGQEAPPNDPLTLSYAYTAQEAA